MTSTTPSDRPRAAKNGRVRRALAGVVRGLLLVSVFAAALAFAIVLHLDLPPLRRTVCQVANRVLAGVFEGRLTVTQISRLGVDGVTFLDVSVVDPEGSRVIDVHELRADADLIGVAQSALFGHGDVEIPVSRVHIDDADVTLDRAPQGELRIVSAFALRPTGAGGRDVRLTLEHIAIDRARAHGAVAASAALDGEVSRLTARLTLAPVEGLTIHVEPTLVVATAPLPGRAQGGATFELHRTGPDEGLSMGATFAGEVGSVGLRAAARMRGDRLEEGTVEVPRATPSEVTSLLPEQGRALRVPVSLRAKAEGELPEVRFSGRLGFDGGGAIDAAGTLGLAPLTVDASVDLRAIDPRVVIDVASAPRIDASGHVKIAGDNVDARTAPFELCGYRIPGVHAQARRADGGWRGTASIDEAGAPMQATFSYDPRRGLDLAVDAEVASLRAVPRVPFPLGGSGRVHAEGSWRSGGIEARVTARFDDLRAPGSAVLEHGALVARVEGPLDVEALKVRASLEGSGLRAGFSSWPRVSAQVDGPLLAPGIAVALGGDHRDPVHVRGALDFGARRFEGVEARLADGEVRLRVARVAWAGGGVRIEGIRLGGAGTLGGNLAIAGGEISGALHGEDVDLDQVARLTGAPWQLAGRAGIDLDLASSRPGLRKGHVAVDVAKGGVADVTGIEGHVAVDFDGDRVRAGGRLRVEGDPACEGVAAEVKAEDGDGRLPGALLDVEAWRRVSGRIHASSADADLACLRRVAPVRRAAVGRAIAALAAGETTLELEPVAAAASLSLPAVRGKLHASAVVERAPGARLPSVRDLSVETRGLEVTTMSCRSRHTDFAIEGGSLDGATGSAEGTLSLRDGETLASLSLSARLDLPAVLGAPERRWASLRRTPFHGRIEVPRHAVTAFAGLPSCVVERLPLLSGSGDTLAGDVQLHAELGGTIDAPTVDARVEGFGLRQATVVVPPPPEPGCTGAPRTPEVRLGPWGLLVDADAHVTYDGREARLDALHVSHDGRTVALASGRVALPIADLLAGRAHPTGDLSIDLDRLPLGEVPALGDLDIGGHLSGTLRVQGLGDRPSGNLSLRLPDLAMGPDLVYDRAEISADVPAPTGGRSEARARVTLSGRAGGDLDVRATAKVAWAHGGLWPEPDGDSPAELTLKAKRFRVLALAPLLPHRVVSRLDGLLDGALRLVWSAGGEAAPVVAELSLRDGVVDLPPLGQRLRDVAFDVTGGAGGAVKLSGLSARGSEGRIQGQGTAAFDRWSLGCADLGCLREAKVELSVSRTETIPIALAGMPLGDAWGNVWLVAAARGGRLALEIAPDVHVALSRSLGQSGQSVQSLDDDPDFEVCYAEKPPVTARRISVAVPLKLELSGKVLDGQVNVVDASLAGELRVDLGGERARTSGEVTVRKGARVALLDKDLEIEGGKITLNPDDARRSRVDVTGHGDLPEGHLELAYGGRAAPIDMDGISCRLGDRGDKACLGVLLSGGAGQVAILKNIAGNVSTTVSVAADGNPEAGLAYGVGPAKVGVSTYYGAGAAGAPGGGGAAGLQGQRTVIKLDYRLFRDWVVRGRADFGGDQQTVGADVLWQHQF